MLVWETLFCVAVVILATAIFLYRFPDRWQAVAALLLVVAVLTSATAFRRDNSADVLETVGPRSVADDGYVSSTSCRSCHPGEHASWHRSFHRTMTEKALPTAIRAPWDGDMTLDGVRYELFRKGDEFWVKTPEPDIDFRERNQNRPPNSAALPLVERRIVMTTGSHHMQMYWMASERYDTELRLFPWVYQIREGRWLPYEQSFVVRPELPRPAVNWNENCIACHSLKGAPGYNPASQKFATQVTELGISCEACHGPAEKHIAKHRNPLGRYRVRSSDDRDTTIVNPAKLSHRQQTQVCGQCHSTFVFHNASGQLDRVRYFDFLRRGFQFRPGEDVEKSRPMLHFSGNLPDDTKNYYWKDGTARIGGREYLGLVKSPCYNKGTMSCLSCHSMHQSDPDDQLTPRLKGNQACLQCHQQMAESVAEHTHHPADSAGSSCYNCHMPRTSYALLGAIRSHRVDSPNVESSIRSGKPNGCNLCHQDKTRTWTAGHLRDWYGIETPTTLLGGEEKTSAWAKWLLQGDAAQRVVAAGNARFPEGREASGDDWQPSLLALLLTDEYAAIRFVAFHSLREHPGYGDLSFDEMQTADSRRNLRDRILSRWESTSQRGLPARLQLESGLLDRERVNELLKNQDRTPIQLIE